MHYFMQSYNMFPFRAEPLFKIACYYIRHQQHAIAYLFAIRAAQLSSSNQSLFVENKVYDYLRYDILGQCALYVGEFAIGKAAILKALEQDPDNKSLYYNLALYEQYSA